MVVVLAGKAPSGSGDGYGDGSGYGYGYWSGYGSGYGYGDGYGSGSGSGDGYWAGYGYGDGDGYGSFSSVPAWIAGNAVQATADAVILYKALDANLRSQKGGHYPIGEMVTAPDWDGGKEECGGGLHFSPNPALAQIRFFESATRFVACEVKLSDMRTPQGSDQYPQKIKARECKVLYECDVYGKPLKEGGA